MLVWLAFPDLMNWGKEDGGAEEVKPGGKEAPATVAFWVACKIEDATNWA